jgi:hypothetical protein
VIGVGDKTRVRLPAQVVDGAIRYDITSKDVVDDWNGKNLPPEKWVRTGDGTVPYAGAVPPFLDRAKLVCIKPGDYGRWELQDRTLTAIGGGFHGILPNMNMLHRMLTVFFRPTADGGKPDAPDFIWGRPAPDLDDRENAWDPPFRGMRRKAD